MNSEIIVKFFSTRRGLFKYLLLLFILSLLALGKSLTFHFYRDDWTQFWYALNDPQLFLSKSTVFIMHPGAAIEEFIGLRFFGLNPFLWQAWGLILRVLNSLAFALMIYAITRSKFIAYLSGLFYVPSVIGIESIIGVSSHTSPLIIIFFCLGFYFWINSKNKFLSLKRVLAILLLFISIWISPIRALPLLLLIPLWEITGLWIKNKKTKLATLLLLIPLFLYIYKYSLLFGSPSYQSFLGDENILIYSKGFLTSLGSLALGWLIPFPESISQAQSSSLLLIAGIVFIIILVCSGLLFAHRRREKYRIYFLLFTLTLLGYLPNWLTAKYMMLGVSHRYLTLSGLGVVGAVAIFISGLRPGIRGILILIYILANIFNSNIILIQQDSYRSFSKTEAIIERLDKDVLPNQKDLIFLFQGGQLRAEIFDMSGVPMFAFKRGITKEGDLPIATGDIELIKKLLCEEGVSRPAMHYWIIQEKKIPLSHIYAWHLDDKGVLTNISERERENIKEELTCDYLR